MKFGSLFAGIGGFDLGFERAGMTCAWQVEKEPTCHEVLRARFPGARLFDDVRAVGAAELEPVDVICGGFPCQDLSVAGKRAGLEGARSGLFYEMARIIGELQPAFVVWENVPGLLSSARGADFAAVLVALDDLGYCGAWSVLDARYFGVAQRRRRLFGVFARAGAGESARRCAEILALAPRLRGNPPPRRATREGVAPTLEGRTTAGGGGWGTDFLAGGGMAVADGGVADPICANEQRTQSHAGNNPRARNVVVVGDVAPALKSKMANGTGGPAGDECQNLVAVSREAYPTARASGVRRLTPRECERLQGFPDGWTALEGMADAARYRMLGNAVAVPCAAWIGRGLVRVLRAGASRRGRHDRRRQDEVVAPSSRPAVRCAPA